MPRGLPQLERSWGLDGSGRDGGENGHDGEKAMGMGMDEKTEWSARGANGLGLGWEIRSGRRQPARPRARPMN